MSAMLVGGLRERECLGGVAPGSRLQLDSPSMATSTSAICIVRMCRVAGSLRSMPPMCIRQLMSAEATTSAPLLTMFSFLVPPMASEVPGIFTLNVPPNPQHSSMLGISQYVRPRTFRKSPSGRLDHAQLAAAVAADVQRDLVREGRPHVGHSQDVDEELGELEHAAAHAHDARARVDVAEKHPAHGRARGRGANDPAVVGKHLAEMLDHRPGLVPVARVERRLAAAGLPVGEDDRHAEPGKRCGHRFADLRVELVDVAGNEHGDRLARTVRRVVLRGAGR